MMMKLPLCLYYGNQIEVKQTEENGENGVDTLLDDTGCTTTGERIIKHNDGPRRLEGKNT